MTYLYTPPTYQWHQVIEGALRYHYPVSTTYYRSGGQWINVTSPGEGNPDIATQVDVDAATGITLYFNRATLVPDSLAGTLAGALTPADPGWTPGTLVAQ